MGVLTDRASLLDEFFRLVNADTSDDDLIEHDTTTGDSYYHLLQAGVYDAQDYLIRCGIGERWAKTSSALSFSGSFPDKYAALPTDFLMLDADDNRSGLRNGKISWGRLIDFKDRFRYTGNLFYLRGNEAASGLEGQLRVYVADGAAVPSSLVADYFYRHATLADSTTVDFPAEDRQLIVAYAARRATWQSWFPGGMEEKDAINNNLRHCEEQARGRARVSRRPVRVPVRAIHGERWYV